ncbi:uncharacterized protein LOC143205021 [Rhynchophorus ferrugineus]|uniref:uncharacterized protein LOC143205021 n=1 Tax=Rhynchophorus ferrugineus TaxID=354439 RepID=UPI003FCEB676
MTDFKNTDKNVEICRLCLGLTVTKMSIFTDDFAKMLEILTSLKVKPDDNLPKISCLKCAKDVKSAFLVRRRIIQSYRSFNNKLNRLELLFDNSSPSDKQLKNFNADGGTNNTHYTAKQSNEKDETENEYCDMDSPEELVNNTPLENIAPTLNVIIKTEVEKDPNIFLEKPDGTEVKANDLTKLKLLQTKQKMNAWKSMNMKHQIQVLRWMEKKKANTKNITSQLATVPPKKREPLKMYCGICQIKFTNKIAFKNHMTRHKHKTCPVCDKQIRSTYLKKHMALHEQTPVICEVCGQTCKNACSLRMHFFYYHKNPSFCVCEDCGRSFRTKTKLLYHQRKDHTKERNYKCETCGKSFFLKIYLTKHINMKHMKLRPHICEYCGKGFSGRHALRTHVRQHTNEAPYHCNLCGERFKQRVSLRGHLKSRHSVEEENTVFCDTCGKGFASDVALDVHSRLHSEIKCPWCTDTFADKNYLEQHINTMHQNIPNNVVEDGGLKWINL